MYSGGRYLFAMSRSLRRSKPLSSKLLMRYSISSFVRVSLEHTLYARQRALLKTPIHAVGSWFDLGSIVGAFAVYFCRDCPVSLVHQERIKERKLFVFFRFKGEVEAIIDFGEAGGKVDVGGFGCILT